MHINEESQHHIEIGKKSKVIFADCLQGLKGFVNDSIHLTFTSPPYWNLIEYAEPGVGTEDEYTKYIESLKDIFAMIYKKTVPGGKFVINVSNIHSRADIDGDEAFLFTIAADVTVAMREVGFLFFDECIWLKGGARRGISALKTKPLFGSYPYPPTPKLLNSTYENILVFKKPGKRDMPKWKDPSKILKDDWFEWTQGIWQVAPDQKAEHPATFPMEIARRIVRLYSFIGERVLDPFAGSGTTIIAAEKHAREGIGFEIARQYEDIIALKAESWLSQLEIPGMEI